MLTHVYVIHLAGRLRYDFSSFSAGMFSIHSSRYADHPRIFQYQLKEKESGAWTISGDVLPALSVRF